MKKEILYQKIATTLSQQIREGTIKTGSKLPSLRTLRQEYGVSMNTVTQAYLELESKGLIVSRPQSGFYVNHIPSRLSVPATSKPSSIYANEGVENLIGKVYYSLNDPSITRLALGIPENELLPIPKLNKALSKATQTLHGSGTEYENVQGNLHLRRQIAQHTYNWNSNLTEKDIVTTAGTMNALSLALMVTTQRGDTIAVESPVYFGILQLAKSLGLNVLELPTHPVTGIEIPALKKVLAKIKVCLLVSNFNNPLGSCMPDGHKKEIVEMLTGHGIILIEDDLYGDIYFGKSRPLPCKSFDESGLVLWCSSVSKTLAPGYRVGWIAPGMFKDKIIHQKLIHTVSSTTVTQEAVALFLENGRYEHHLRNLRRQLHANSLHFIRTITECFPENTKISRPQGGFMLWVELHKDINTAELFDIAIKHKISIAPGRMFSLQDQFNNCMRLSFGQLWSEKIHQKLYELGKIIKDMQCKL